MNELDKKCYTITAISGDKIRIITDKTIDDMKSLFTSYNVKHVSIFEKETGGECIINFSHVAFIEE